MAGRLTIEWTPLDPTGITDRAIAATWASLSVQAVDGGRSTNLTRVLDRHARTERQEVYGTVLPLAEWVARCWHSLFSAKVAWPPRLAPRSQRSAWQKTHRWRSCAEGTAVPDLELLRVDDELFECRWTNSVGDDDDEFERVLFLTRGAVRVQVEELRRTLAEFVDSVLARLGAEAPGDPRASDLQAAWLVARDPNSRDFGLARFAARIGLHWWALRDPERDALVVASKAIVNPLAEVGLEAAMQGGLDAWVDECAGLWRRCAGAPPAAPEWAKLRAGLVRDSQASPSGSRPWDRGWTAARLLRDHLGRPHGQPWEAAEVHARIGSEVADSRGSAKAIIGWAAGRRPLIARRSSKISDTNRFAQARDLFPLLFRGQAERDFGCVLSERIAGTLPVANAFAAELLAPVESVRRVLSGRDRVGGDDLFEIAAELGAPAQCVLHQIENHELADVV